MRTLSPVRRAALIKTPHSADARYKKSSRLFWHPALSWLAHKFSNMFFRAVIAAAA